MNYPFPPDVAKLVQDQMVSGRYASEDNVLRVALTVLGQADPLEEERDQEYWDTVAAIQQGLSEAEAGLLTPLEEVLDEARRELNGDAG